MANNPYVNKVVYGNQTIFDISTDTVIPSVLARNVTALSADGSLIVGTLDISTKVESTEVISYPSKILYQVNEPLDLSGVKVAEISPDGFIRDITNSCVFSPANGTILSTLGTNTVSITYGNYLWTFIVYVSEGQYQVPTWSGGSDSEIEIALQLHYRNVIDLHDYWNVGDTRTIHIPAIEAKSTLTEAMAEQDVSFVILDKGGKELVTPVNNHTECAFIIGNVTPLNGKGAINTSRTAAGGWEASMIRGWCNDDFYNAIPTNSRAWFKLHKNETANGSGSAVSVVSQDYVALVAEKEYLGRNSQANATAEINLHQFSYFTNTLFSVGSYARSPRQAANWVVLTTTGSGGLRNCEEKNYLCLFGVI